MQPAWGQLGQAENGWCQPLRIPSAASWGLDGLRANKRETKALMYRQQAVASYAASRYMYLLRCLHRTRPQVWH